MRQRRFYEQLRRGLRPGGVAVVNVVLDDEDDELELMGRFADVFSDVDAGQDVAGAGRLADSQAARRRLHSLAKAMEAADATPHPRRRVPGWGGRLASVVAAGAAASSADSARLLRWLARRGARCAGSAAEARLIGAGVGGAPRPDRDELRRRRLVAAADSDGDDGDDGGGGSDGDGERGCKPGCALLSARRLRQMMLDGAAGDDASGYQGSQSCWACLAVVTPQTRNLLLVGGAKLQ